MISFAKLFLRFSRRLLLFLLAVFILPALLHLGVWSLTDRPDGWRQATWSSAGILPLTPSPDEATIYVMTARTGGIKGAFATHSWLVLKPLGASTYDRYDVVGWGNPVRKNAYDADGHWYSNKPKISYRLTGKKAELLLPQVEKAIAAYRWRKRGDYTIWPGPNSNTFVASVLGQIPGLAAATPSTAIGRDFPADGRWIGRRKNGALFATLGGYFGVVAGGGRGLEINFLGLVAGINPGALEVAIPAFGALRFPELAS
ncbi:hypothetical protein LA5095_01307 [Roseibium album]|uniref:DUF3750 domain-containing protein n=1 Tax=Roseibium album TaxID=311410 RepID=A0A0M6Z6G4_9HYPH|nr:hypothetical protein LA5094_00583 [Roseibium album]CTQ68196.1 hypothetical protein LA5095_01307 [Roseibium album]CTQ70542.1 hypothetical protein LA5096_02562 [Roseibium album]